MIILYGIDGADRPAVKASVPALGLMPLLHISIARFFASVVLDIFINIPFEKREASGNIFATGISDMKESFSFMLPQGK